MAKATDISDLRKLEDDEKEHGKTSTKLKSYATGALNLVPFLNQSGISYPGPKEYEAKGKGLSRSIASEREAIKRGERDYIVQDEAPLPKGMIEKKAKGGKVTASSRADGLAQRGKTRGKMI